MKVHYVCVVAWLLLSVTTSLSTEEVDPSENVQPVEGTVERTVEGTVEGAVEGNDVENPTELGSGEQEVTDAEAPTNSTEETSSSNTTVFMNCTRGGNISHAVELVNSTRLVSLLTVNPNVTRAIAADCLAVYFYARWCPFSAMAAPHFNALPRAFPELKMVAVDAMKYHTFNTQYGVVGVPTMILFHNGRPAIRFNESDYTLEKFSSFIMKYTSIPPLEKTYVTSADFGGPVPSSVLRERDFFLWLAWAFLALSAVIFFTKSSWCRWLVEAVQNTWRESEAQHDHMD